MQSIERLLVLVEQYITTVEVSLFLKTCTETRPFVHSVAGSDHFLKGLHVCTVWSWEVWLPS